VDSKINAPDTSLPETKVMLVHIKEQTAGRVNSLPTLIATLVVQEDKGNNQQQHVLVVAAMDGEDHQVLSVLLTDNKYSLTGILQKWQTLGLY
jgi:hypothetical protein